MLLAESINSQNKTLSAQIREVLRCLTTFDRKGYRLRCIIARNMNKPFGRSKGLLNLSVSPATFVKYIFVYYELQDCRRVFGYRKALI